MKSSGLFFEKREDGSFLIGYEDYDVELFGGDDIEVTYYLDENNYKILKEKLGLKGEMDTEIKLKRSFGLKFSSLKFCEFCQENKIQYKKNILIL